MTKKQVSLLPPPPQSFLTKYFLLLTTALLLTFSFASCGDGSESAPDPTSRVFESKDSAGNTYILEVLSASASRAAYTPKSGDTFTLTIITSAGNTWKETGTVSTSGTTLTLSGTTTLTVNVSGNGMTSIAVTSGTITINSSTFTIPAGTLTPTKLPDPTTIKLVANYTPEGGNWACGWILSDITKFTPTKNLKFKFRVSGTTDKTLEKAQLMILAHKNYDNYQWLGESGEVRLSGTFDKTFLITIPDNPTPGHTIQVNLQNEVRPPANAVLNETVLATIKNFELRFIGLE